MNSPVLADQKSLRYLLQSLHPKEQLYVEARARGSVPVAAARMAGYVDPDAKAAELEANSMVRTALEYMLRVAAHELTLTKQDVIAGIQDAIAVATTAGERISGWKEIGKLIGAYEPTKVQIDHNLKVTKESLQKLSDEELAKMAAIDAQFVRLTDEEEKTD